MNEPRNIDRRATAGGGDPSPILGSINFGPYDRRPDRLPLPEGRLLPRTTFPVEGLLGAGAPPRREVDQIEALVARLEVVERRLGELDQEIARRLEAIDHQLDALVERVGLAHLTQGRASALTKETLMVPKTRAKFTCNSVEKDAGGTTVAHFNPVYSGSEENAQFFRATPGGTISLYTLKGDHFEQGKTYYVDFTPAPD